MQFGLAHSVGGRVKLDVGNTSLEHASEVRSEINDDDEKWEENGEEVPLIETEFGEGEMACVGGDSVPEFITIIVVVNLKGGAFRGGLGGGCCWWSFVLVN